MDLRQLATIVAVAEQGSFSAAAVALHTVQSNVSAHIARLEKDLGTSLFDRAAGALTEEGQLVVERARRIAREVESLQADLTALHDVVAGTVRLGTIGTTARWLVPRLLAVIAERHPGVRLVVSEGTSTTLEPRLISGSIDIALLNLPLHVPELETEPMFEEDLLLVVPPTHPLAGADAVDITALDGLEMLLPPEGTPFRNELDLGLRAAGVTLRPKAELDGVRLIASLTFEGHGPAILPATALPSWLRGEWRAIRVQGLSRRRVGLALKRRSRPAAPARALLVILRELLADTAHFPDGIHLPES
ncbi:MAG TPA: LysR substrate-binding domain-containing protein [Acidimicrobiales bacterium]|nr:LysR substrate-binding domain-containing protein [Acidimicrobiales bacterium]